jgi:hypothetical protein
VTDAAPEVSASERRALWADVLRWPLKGGMLGGVFLFAVLAYASASFEGGSTSSQRDEHAMVRAVVIFAALLVLGIYSWRALVCSWPAERPVPWGRDDGYDVPLSRVFSTFFPVLFFSFLPMVVWLAARGFVHAPSWVDWLVIFATAIYAGAVFPLGLAGAVVRGSPLAALPGPVARMRRAEPYAAGIASKSGVIFVVALVFSAWLAARFVVVPADYSILSDASIREPVTVPAWLFVALVLLRGAGFYAALVSFRVAGLLVREVPEISEVLK